MSSLRKRRQKEKQGPKTRLGKGSEPEKAQPKKWEKSKDNTLSWKPREDKASRRREWSTVSMLLEDQGI